MHCELCIVNCATNVNLGAAGVAGATYFMLTHIYARARTCTVEQNDAHFGHNVQTNSINT